MEEMQTQLHLFVLHIYLGLRKCWTKVTIAKEMKLLSGVAKGLMMV